MVFSIHYWRYSSSTRHTERSIGTCRQKFMVAAVLGFIGAWLKVVFVPPERRSVWAYFRR